MARSSVCGTQLPIPDSWLKLPDSDSVPIPIRIMIAIQSPIPIRCVYCSYARRRLIVI